MLSPSEFNNAVPKFTNGNYANNPVDPQYIEEPTLQDYNRGVEPLETLPAQWWNWLCNQFTSRFNKINTYVKNIFDEITQLLSLLNISPDGTESAITTGQLKNFFKELYPTYVSDKLELGTTYVPQTRTVNGHALTGNITITKSDVGLGNVDNTSDVDKPVSTAQATAISTAINALDVASVGGSGKYLSAISETDGKISATAGDIDSVVTANSNNLITSGGVANAINNLPIDRFTSIFTGGYAQIYHIGRTIGAQSTQAYTNIYFRAGRVDNEYGCGFISIYKKGLIDGKLLLGMQNVSVIFTQIDNEIDMYVKLDSYTGFVFDVAPNSKFTVNIQEVSQIDGNIIWNNAWKLITTTADITNQVTVGDSAAVSSGAVANYAIAKSELVPGPSKFIVSNMRDEGYPNLDGTTIFANNAWRVDNRNGVRGVSNPTTRHQWPINSSSTKDEFISLGTLQFYIDKANDKIWIRSGNNIDMGDWYKVLTSNDVTNQVTSGDSALVSSGTLYNFFGGNTDAKSWLSKAFGWAMGRYWNTCLMGPGSLLVSLNRTVYTIYYANNLWVAGSDKGIIWSEDGEIWGLANGTASYTFKHIYYAKNIWVACSTGQSLWWSTDGKTWTQGDGVNTNYSFNHVYYAKNIWVACSESHGMYWSSNGKTWTQGTGSNTSYTFNDVYYGNNIWVAGSESHGLWWSSNGKAWTQGTGSNTNYTFNSVRYADYIWVAGSDSHGLWWSSDGKAWNSSYIASTTVTINYIYYANGMWQACGEDKMLYSSDGKNFKPEYNPFLANCRSVYYANGTWVAGTDKGLIWSINGKNWQLGKGDERDNYSQCQFLCVYFAKNYWLAGGIYNAANFVQGFWYSDFDLVELKD